jgi:ferritin
MYESLPQLLEESIKLELNVSELYEIFSSAFLEDADFWKKLSLEEENHAVLIKLVKVELLSSDEFPSEILSSSLENLIVANNRLFSLLKEYKDNPPSREKAFNVAISIEESAGEIHFQNATKMTSDLEYIKTFQRLNKDEKDHSERIRTYMSDKGIKKF